MILRDAIAETFGLDPARIVCGNGSDELLTLLAHGYLRPGDEVLFSAHALPGLPHRDARQQRGAGRGAGEEPHASTSTRCWRSDADRTRLVYLANPNNPTGSYLPHDEVRRLHAGLRPDTCW